MHATLGENRSAHQPILYLSTLKALRPSANDGGDSMQAAFSMLAGPMILPVVLALGPSRFGERGAQHRFDFSAPCRADRKIIPVRRVAPTEKEYRMV